MKLSIQQAINQLNSIESTESEIFIWFRTKEDMECSELTWGKLEDGSEGLEEMINGYLTGWIEEIELND